jgi:serine protease Do/serine protease DegQ
MVDRVTRAVINVSGIASAQVPSGRRAPSPSPGFGNEEDRAERGRPRSIGSGVIIDAKQGLVVTNHHVAQGEQKMFVTLRDRREFEATVVGSDAGTDIALLRIPAEDLTAASVGDSDKMTVGDYVVAIGNPFGIGQTVTSGIVSATGRSLRLDGYEEFIQTDAPINPGNSGGALVNLNGELIGINTAIIGAGGGGARAGNVGIGFAVPSNMMQAVVAQILRFGEVRRGRVGLTTVDNTPRLARSRGLPMWEGAVVTQVEKGSPGERAGVRVGDVVTAINGRAIRTQTELRNRLGLIPVGDRATLSLFSQGKTRTADVQIAGIAPVTAQGGPARAPQLQGAAVTNGPDGVLVTRVDPGSPAHMLGLREGDVIDAINKQKVNTVEDIQRLLQGADRYIMAVLRGDTKVNLVIS